jgi:hypothetical protein
MIIQISFIRYFFFFLLLANTTFASEIRIVIQKTDSKFVSVKLQKDNLLLDSARFDPLKKENIVLISSFQGIHCLSFGSESIVYIYLKEFNNLEVNVDLEKGKFEVIDSFESKQMNRIFHNWEKEVSKLISLNAPTFEHFDEAFDSLASEILSSQNPEIIDWASVFLVELENDPDKYMLSLEKFIDFEQLVQENYPSFKFSKMKTNFGVRKDNQSGYYWKY